MNLNHFWIKKLSEHIISNLNFWHHDATEQKHDITETIFWYYEFTQSLNFLDFGNCFCKLKCFLYDFRQKKDQLVEIFKFSKSLAFFSFLVTKLTKGNQKNNAFSYNVIKANFLRKIGLDLFVTMLKQHCNLI